MNPDHSLLTTQSICTSWHNRWDAPLSGGYEAVIVIPNDGSTLIIL